MKKNIKKNVLADIMIVIAIAMIVQIVYGFLWAFLNLNTERIYFETIEYKKLSNGMMGNQWYPILYPLLLKGMQCVEKWTQISYYIPVYTFQIILSAIAAVYFTDTILKSFMPDEGRSINKKFYKCFPVLGGLYAVSFPVIMQMNVSLSADSVALSLFMTSLSCLIRLFRADKDRIWIRKEYWVLAIGIILLGNLEMRYYYAGIIALVLLSVWTLFIYKVKTKNRKKVLPVLLVIVTSILLTTSIHRLTTENDYKMAAYTPVSILMNRMVYPYLKIDFYSYSDELRYPLYEEYVRGYSQNKQNMIHDIMPWIESYIGKEEASSKYKEMIKFSWEKRKREIVNRLIQDNLYAIFLPFSLQRTLRSNQPSFDQWNYDRMTMSTHVLTSQYMKVIGRNTCIAIVCCGLWEVFIHLGGIRKKQFKLDKGSVVRGLFLFVFGMFFVVSISSVFAVMAAPGADYRNGQIFVIMWETFVTVCFSKMYVELRGNASVL